MMFLSDLHETKMAAHGHHEARQSFPRSSDSTLYPAGQMCSVKVINKSTGYANANRTRLSLPSILLSKVQPW